MKIISVFQEIFEILDKLIQCQKREQEFILARQASELQGVCTDIQNFTNLLQHKQSELEQLIAKEPELRKSSGSFESEYKTKFNIMQTLALQNHLLLENSLIFLEGIFAQVLGSGKKSDVYNAMGMMPTKMGEAGNFVDLKV
jgi:hypothetical protein